MYLKFGISDRFLSSKVEFRRLDCIGPWGDSARYQQIFLKTYNFKSGSHDIQQVPNKCDIQDDELPESRVLGSLSRKECHISICNSGRFRGNHCCESNICIIKITSKSPSKLSPHQQCLQI